MITEQNRKLIKNLNNLITETRISKHQMKTLLQNINHLVNNNSNKQYLIKKKLKQKYLHTNNKK